MCKRDCVAACYLFVAWSSSGRFARHCTALQQQNLQQQTLTLDCMQQIACQHWQMQVLAHLLTGLYLSVSRSSVWVAKRAEVHCEGFRPRSATAAMLYLIQGSLLRLYMMVTPYRTHCFLFLGCCIGLFVNHGYYVMLESFSSRNISHERIHAWGAASLAVAVQAVSDLLQQRSMLCSSFSSESAP